MVTKSRTRLSDFTFTFILVVKHLPERVVSTWAPSASSPVTVLFQVTEETSIILQTLGYTCTCRGIINVKGKGDLKTYFVNTEMSRSLSQSNLTS